jgi:hypothetical protein
MMNECLLIKLMQIRNTPIINMEFDQNRVDRIYQNWVTDGFVAEQRRLL